MPQAKIKINGVDGPNLDLPIATLVNLSNDGTGGEVTFLWAILDQPAGPADLLSSSSSPTPTFTPRKEGTYLLKLTVNGALVNQTTAVVLQVKTRTRVPAAGETTESSSSEGWHGTALEQSLQMLDSLKADPGLVVCSAGGAGLVPGNVVQFGGDAVIKSGLPGQETVPSVTLAQASTAAEVSWDLGVLVSGVNGSSSPSSGDLVYVRRSGLLLNVNQTSPALGGTLYASDAGVLSATPGTNTRAVARCVNVIDATHFDAWVSGEAGSLAADLAGDVTGPLNANTLNSTIATAVAWSAVQDFDDGITIATGKSVLGDAELNLFAASGHPVIFKVGSTEVGRFTAGLSIGTTTDEGASCVTVHDYAAATPSGLFSDLAGGTGLVELISSTVYLSHTSYATVLRAAALTINGTTTTFQISASQVGEIQTDGSLYWGSRTPILGGAGSIVLGGSGPTSNQQISVDYSGTLRPILKQDGGAVTVGNIAATFSLFLEGWGNAVIGVGDTNGVISFYPGNVNGGRMFPSGGFYWGSTFADPGANNLRVQGQTIMNGGEVLVPTGPKTGTYTTTANDRYVETSTALGAWVLTLVDASTVPNGFRLKVQDIGGVVSTANLTIAAHSGQFIQGAYAQVLLVDNEGSYEFVSDGVSSWTIEGRVCLSGNVSTFGNAGDGDVTFDGTSTVLGLVPSGGIYTMNRDIHARNLKLTNSGTIVITNGYRLFAQLALTTAAGTSITNSVGGHTGGPGATLAAGGNGGVGTTGAGANGTATANTYAGSAGNGGTGTSGSGGTGGGTTSPVGQSVYGAIGLSGATWSAAGGLVGVAGGGGGGAGAGDGSNNGGNGGGGGGVVLIAALFFNNLGTVASSGANGANASAGNTGGGGGGGGGEIIIGFGVMVNQGTISLAGGTGGTGHGTGTNGANGSAGTAIIMPA